VSRSATQSGGKHINSGLARRYATALYASAKQRGVQDQVEADLTSTAELFQTERAFRDFLLKPDVLDEHKAEIVTRSLGPRVLPLTLHFLQLLLKKRRLDHLEVIQEVLRELIETDRGIVHAKVTTAVELKPELREKLKARLAAITGKTIILDLEVDLEIIGGVVVQLHNQLVDGSLRRELDRLRDDLMAVRVI
jgi:F-type H+-transporting ATPase subunit delta